MSEPEIISFQQHHCTTQQMYLKIYFIQLNICWTRKINFSLIFIQIHYSFLCIKCSILNKNIAFQFSVAIATLQSLMSVCQSVCLSICKTPQPLRIMPISQISVYKPSCHLATMQPPSQLLRIIDISHHVYQSSCQFSLMPNQPSCQFSHHAHLSLSAIMPITYIPPL